MQYTNEEIINDLKSRLSEKRFLHSLRVAETAKEIAIANNLDGDKAYLAGLIHDCTKEMSEEWQDKTLIENNDEEKINVPRKVKHGYTAKYYARDVYGIKDLEVLNGAYYHVICESNKPLDMIIYIADKREPGRKIDDDILDIAYKDLNKAFKKCQNDVNEYLKGKGING